MLCFIGGVRVAHLFSFLCCSSFYWWVRVAHLFIGGVRVAHRFIDGVRVAHLFIGGVRVAHRFIGGVRVAHLFSFLCCVLLVGSV